MACSAARSRSRDQTRNSNVAVSRRTYLAFASANEELIRVAIASTAPTAIVGQDCARQDSKYATNAT